MHLRLYQNYIINILIGTSAADCVNCIKNQTDGLWSFLLSVVQCSGTNDHRENLLRSQETNNNSIEYFSDLKHRIVSENAPSKAFKI